MAWQRDDVVDNMTPAPVGHIFWDRAKITGWRKDEGGGMTQVFRKRDGEIIDIWSIGRDDDNGLVVKLVIDEKGLDSCSGFSSA